MKKLFNAPLFLILIAAVLVFVGSTQRLNGKDGDIWLIASLMLFTLGIAFWLMRKLKMKNSNSTKERL